MRSFDGVQIGMEVEEQRTLEEMPEEIIVEPQIWNTAFQNHCRDFAKLT